MKKVRNFREISCFFHFPRAIFKAHAKKAHKKEGFKTFLGKVEKSY